MENSNRRIAPERKAIYYVGMALTVIGVLLFLSVFFSAAANFGNFENFSGRVRSEMFRAITGMVLMVAGSVAMMVGAKGLAGSGVILDPERARKDVEPWSRMSGGVVQDALSEVNVVRKAEEWLDESNQQVKIRCRQCRSLNDELAKFCDQCGGALT